MSSGTHTDLDWAGTDSAHGRAGTPAASAPNAGSAPGVAHLTDEEILGMDPPSPEVGFGGLARQVSSGDGKAEAKVARDAVPQPSEQLGVAEAMPVWMQAVAADPKHAGEAQQLWQERQAFRAAFSSPEEARAMRDLLPGGAQEVQALRQIAQEVDSLRNVAREAETLRQNAASLREAAESVDRIDAAIFSGDVRAQSEVVAEMARANPAAFRSLFAEAAKVLAGMDYGSREAGGRGEGSRNSDGVAANGVTDRPTFRENREGWGTRQTSSQAAQVQGQHAVAASTSVASHETQVTSHASQELRASQSPHFDAAAYASFERATNDVVARDVRGSISETLGRVLPEGVAEGAARRIGEDIFNEVHRALAADRSLSEQVGEVLRERRFGSGEQQRVASLVAGRAKQLVPSVARRVIGEWTSSVLGTARTKAARQAAAAARVDIAAPGGSLDSMPLRAMSAREVNYASMSDDEILGM
jgi:hypothetical protein